MQMCLQILAIAARRTCYVLKPLLRKREVPTLKPSAWQALCGIGNVAACGAMRRVKCWHPQHMRKLCHVLAADQCHGISLPVRPSLLLQAQYRFGLLRGVGHAPLISVAGVLLHFLWLVLRHLAQVIVAEDHHATNVESLGVHRGAGPPLSKWHCCCSMLILVRAPHTKVLV